MDASAEHVQRSSPVLDADHRTSCVDDPFLALFGAKCEERSARAVSSCTS